MTIFHDRIKETMEVVMDDFSVFRDSFSSYLTHLDKMLKRYEDTNVVLNWEQCHFMVKEGIVLGHKISKSGIEVDNAKFDVIAKLPHPTTVRGIRCFLGHARFYRQFIQDFSKIARPMTHLLEKETPFFFSKECIKSFEILKKKLTEAPILVAPDWDLPFEIMCDASDYAVGAILRQRKTKHFQTIHYASKTMTDVQSHYTTTKKELLAVVYAFEKFRPYLVLSKTIVYTDHLALKYLLAKQDSKPRLLRDRGTQFFNDQFAKVMLKYGITHRLSTEYHPQTSRQVEVSNCGLKCILERTVGENRASWFDKLDDALWAFYTMFKTPIGCTPYKLVYGKACHLPIELEHKVYWALKHCNFGLKTAGYHRKVQMNELNELHDQVYENSLIYKQKTNKIHESKIKNRILNIGDRVLLFNSRLKIFSGKLKTRWTRPFIVAQVFPYGTVELSLTNGPNLKGVFVWGSSLRGEGAADSSLRREGAADSSNLRGVCLAADSSIGGVCLAAESGSCIKGCLFLVYSHVGERLDGAADSSHHKGVFVWLSELAATRGMFVWCCRSWQPLGGCLFGAAKAAAT
nr:reverse transcriptase domain-containing protein [Tanacetum cinerariifolium]